jgi:hypothetical protein
MNRFSVCVADDHRREAVVGVVVIVKRDCELLEIVRAAKSTTTPHVLYLWKIVNGG